MDYISEAMATVGCGVSDIKEIANIVDGLTDKQLDVLDTWHNLGQSIELSTEYKQVGTDLKQEFSDDDIICLQTYVNAYRNIN